MNFFYLFISISILMISCQKRKESGTDSNIISGDRAKLIYLSADYPECKDTITLSQITEDLFYVALDLDKNTDIVQLYYTDSLVIVNDCKNIHLFDHSGKKINKISLFSGSFDLSTDRKYLYTYAFLNKEISKYNLKGEKIGRTKLKNNNFGYYGYFFSVVNDTLFAISNVNEGYNKDQLIFVDEKGRIVDHIPNSEQFIPPPNIYSFSRKWHRTLSRQNNKLYYHPFYNDTLFIIEKNKRIPYAIENKIQKVPFHHRIEYTGESPNSFIKYCQKENKYATRFYNSSRYLILEYRNGSLNYSLSNYLIYDKKNKTLSRTYNNLKKGFDSKILHFGIFNDFDGGLAFSPSHLCDNYLIMVNAGEMQGKKGNNTPELYKQGRMIKDTLYKCRSDQFIHFDYRKKAEEFFNEQASTNKLILTIVKLKSL